MRQPTSYGWTRTGHRARPLVRLARAARRNRRLLLELAAGSGALLPLALWADAVISRRGLRGWWEYALLYGAATSFSVYIQWWRSRLPANRAKAAEARSHWLWVTAKRALDPRFRRGLVAVGYDPQEVDGFLSRLHEDLLRLEDLYRQRVEHGVTVEPPSDLIAPEEIRRREFPTKRGGYRMVEVDHFLDSVVWTRERLLGIPEDPAGDADARRRSRP